MKKMKTVMIFALLGLGSCVVWTDRGGEAEGGSQSVSDGGSGGQVVQGGSGGGEASTGGSGGVGGQPGTGGAGGGLEPACEALDYNDVQYMGQWEDCIEIESGSEPYICDIELDPEGELGLSCFPIWVDWDLECEGKKEWCCFEE